MNTEFKQIAIWVSEEDRKTYRELDLKYEQANAEAKAMQLAFTGADVTTELRAKLSRAVRKHVELDYEWADMANAIALNTWHNERVTNPKLPERFVDCQFKLSCNRIEFSYYEEESF